MAYPASENITVEAPLSFAGSARRIWRLFNTSPWLQWLLGLPLITLAWTVVTCWYVVFGLWLVPYRLIRRGQRKRRLADIRHQEMLAAMQQRQGGA